MLSQPAQRQRFDYRAYIGLRKHLSGGRYGYNPAMNKFADDTLSWGGCAYVRYCTERFAGKEDIGTGLNWHGLSTCHPNRE